MIKLPKEVLDLFPLWEHRCPICQTYVEPTAIRCPKCLAVFNEEKWRVPPRFLKSQKAMSDYAHKVLAPKLTEHQRTLLFRYFTDVFNDGFESGDFSAWTGTQVTAGETVSVVNTDPHHGSHHCNAQLNANDYWERASCYKTFASSYSIIYGRAYFKFKTAPDYSDLLVLAFNAAGGTVAMVGMGRWGGDRYWILKLLEGGAMVTTQQTDATIALNTWYCLELYVKVDGTAGEAILYVNGVSKISRTNKDTNDNGNVNQIEIGFAYSHAAAASQVYADCCKVADTYIGVEAAGQIYEINVDALANASASHLEQCTLSIAKEASITSQVATLNFEMGIPKEALVQTLSLHSEETLYGILKDVVVKALADPLTQSTFNLTSEAVVKVLAEVSVVKEGEVKVTRLFLVLGDLAIQLQGD